MFKRIKNTQGFTLIEVLLVVAIIAILAGIVILAINPNKQLGDSKNAQRAADVTTILNATYQYLLDEESLPASLTGVTTATEICATGVTPAVCVTDGLIDLSVLTDNEKYLVSIPLDPVASGNGVGYTINLTANNRVTVSAPDAENGEVITVTR